MDHQETEKSTIWVNEQEKIASFHYVETYKAQTFENKDFFSDYVRSLQERGFRFQ